MDNVNTDIHININGVDIDWDLKNGNLNFLGISSTLFWDDPSLLNMFHPLVKEIGKEMFCLLVAHSSSLGTQKDYNTMVTKLGKDFEEGFLNWGKAVSGAGWGVFEMPSLDIKNFKATVIVTNPWELEMQSSLDAGERWGCPFLQGKIIGIFKHAFGHTCWADMHYEFFENSNKVEFSIYLNEVTIDNEIEKLRKKIEKKKVLDLKAVVEKNTKELRDSKKENEIALQRLDRVLKGSNDGFWDWNIQNNEVYFSKQWKLMLGYEENEITPTLYEWEKRVHPDDIERVLKDMQNHMDGKTLQFATEHRMLCKDNTFKWILTRGSIIEFSENGEPLIMSGTHTDISQRKELQKNIELAKEKAEKANKFKSQFLANMSHEIRTPLNGIIGLTKLVLKTKLDDKQNNYLSKVQASSQTLLHIINDILDYSKIESGKLELENRTFHLNEVLQSIEDMFKLTCQDKGLSFKIQNTLDGIKLQGDPLRLTQILINLTSNAIKFTQKGEILINVKQVDAEKDFQRIEFKIQDTGTGIEDEALKTLFKPFIQADSSTTRKYGGTGLGLTIVKQLVEMMSGKVWINSELGDGSTFFFTAVFEKSIHTQRDETQDLNSLMNFEGKYILVAEDNKTNQLVIEGILEDYNLNIDFANNGQEAVDKVKSNFYDLILMDLQMPIMDGFEATKIIKKIKPNLTIIALTANAMKEDKEKTRLVGMEAHLTKPIDKSSLEKVLNTFLEE